MDEVAESLRRADGALPRGRGDLPRGDRRRRSRTAPTTARSSRSPAGSRPQPRHQPAARRDRRGPALAGQARRPRGRRGDARAGRGQGAVRLRVQDPRRPVRRADQPVPRLPGRAQAGLAGAEHAHPRQGADRPAADLRGQTDRPRERVRPRRHRRRREAQGDARRRLARRARRADRDARRSSCRRR